MLSKVLVKMMSQLGEGELAILVTLHGFRKHALCVNRQANFYTFQIVFTYLIDGLIDFCLKLLFQNGSFSGV